MVKRDEKDLRETDVVEEEVVENDDDEGWETEESSEEEIDTPFLRELLQAFTDLNKSTRVVALSNFTCCNTCGHYEAPDKVKVPHRIFAEIQMM